MTDKILIDRELLERVQTVLSRWSGIINYQYNGSQEAMTYLQIADDASQPVLNEVSAALAAVEKERGNGEMMGASRLAGEASSAEGATSTVVLDLNSKGQQ